MLIKQQRRHGKRVAKPGRHQLMVEVVEQPVRLAQQPALVLLKLAVGDVHQGSHQRTTKCRIRPHDRQLHHQHQQLVFHLEGIGNKQLTQPLERDLPGAPLLQARRLEPRQQAAGRLVVGTEIVDVIHQLKLLRPIGAAVETLFDTALDQRIILEGFEQIIPRTGTQGAGDCLHGALGRNDDNRNMGIARREAGDHLVAIHIGHIEIAEHHIRMVEGRRR